MSKEERRENKKRKRHEIEDTPYTSGFGLLVKDKSSQTEMTKQATMRREEARQNAVRSGRNPGADNNWTGSTSRLRVKVYKWDELKKQQRRDIVRKEEGKFKKKKLTGDQRKARKAAFERQARIEAGGELAEGQSGRRPIRTSTRTATSSTSTREDVPTFPWPAHPASANQPMESTPRNQQQPRRP